MDAIGLEVSRRRRGARFVLSTHTRSMIIIQKNYRISLPPLTLESHISGLWSHPLLNTICCGISFWYTDFLQLTESERSHGSIVLQVGKIFNKKPPKLINTEESKIASMLLALFFYDI